MIFSFKVIFLSILERQVFLGILLFSHSPAMNFLKFNFKPVCPK